MIMNNEQIKKDVQEQFGKNAQNYVTSQSHAKGKDLGKLLEISECKSNMSVLDIATGGGHVANALAPLVKHVTALDLTKEILKAAESFITSNGIKNVSFIEGSADELPFDEAVFDMITCRIAAHHFPEVHSFLKEAYRVLKPGGIFLLIDNVAPEQDDFDHFYNWVEKARDYSHQRAYKKSEWLRMTEEVGFELREMHRFEKDFHFETWCEKMSVSVDKKKELTNIFLKASGEVKKKFLVRDDDSDQIESFQGQSILMKMFKV
ncbi:SAM-dependent methyltransferase [Alkalihalobacillus pseudalcaliphilus]|nr:SAM-dependent methyltransferase [Alkalihalobacillus pseudalcaliphilus]